MAKEPVTVLYIGGSGRSGSTILGNALGSATGFFSAGEVRYLFDRGLQENRPCGCGRPFRDCELWTRVLESAGAAGMDLEPTRLLALRDRVRARQLALLLLPGGAERFAQRAAPLAAALSPLYRAIATVSGASVVLDTSKFPSYARVLEVTEGVRLFVVHLVRDPRAVAYSWLRRRPDPGAPAGMDRHSPGKSSLYWNVFNAAFRGMRGVLGRRYLLVRYEDFVAAPAATLGRIFEFAGVREAGIPFTGDRELVLRENHTVAGNPSRFRTGPTRIEADAAWQRKMKRKDRALVTALTRPWLGLYGYEGRTDF